MRERSPRSVLVTVLFTDIVASTQVAEELGDRRWRELLQRHHAIIRRELRRFQGREIDTAGDGFFAVFPRPADAIRCAAACVEAVRELGVEIRTGLHAGEAEVIGKKVSGMSVHIGARVLGVAGAGEVLVTQTVRELIPGAGLEFADRGTHSLKGVPGEWRVFSLRSVDNALLPPALDPGTARERRDLIQPKLRGRRLLWPAVAGFAVVAVGSTALLLTRSGGPTPGASGSPTLPVAAPISDRLVLIDPATNTITADYALPGDPGAIAVGQDALWVILTGQKQVVRIDPATGSVAARIDVDGRPTSLIEGLGWIWVVSDGGTLTKIDPEANTIEDTLSLGGSLRAVTVADGSVWTADVGATVTRVNADVLRVEKVIETQAMFNAVHERAGASLTADDRAVWVMANQTIGVSKPVTVWRIDLATMELRFAFITPYIQSPSEATTGPGGIWIASATDQAVIQLEPPELDLRLITEPDIGPGGGNRDGVTSVRVSGEPRDIAVGADGNIWAIDPLSGVVWRIDPFTKAIIRTIEVRKWLTSVAVDERGVWITVNAP